MGALRTADHASRPSAEGRIADIAARQGGVMTAAQLMGCGLSRSAVYRRVASDRLHRLGPGVFRVGPILTADGGRRAALWAGGSGTALSFFSAAELLDCGSRDPRAHHVTVAGGRHFAGPDWLVVHRARRLPPDDVVRRRGFPVTSAARTALDLACAADRRTLRAVVEEMLHKRLLTGDTFTALSTRHPGHPGLAALLGLAPDRTPTESHLEDRVRERILDGLPLPEPEPQYDIVGLSGQEYRADFAYVEAKVLIEADSRRHHERAAAFESDRDRDADLAGVGWQTLRFTHAQTQDAVAQSRQRVVATVTPRLPVPGGKG